MKGTTMGFWGRLFSKKEPSDAESVEKPIKRSLAEALIDLSRGINNDEPSLRRALNSLVPCPACSRQFTLAYGFKKKALACPYCSTAIAEVPD
jgi:hypothetical protein